MHASRPAIGKSLSGTFCRGAACLASHAGRALLICATLLPASSSAGEHFDSPASLDIALPAGAGRKLESEPFSLPSEGVDAAQDRNTQGLVAWFTELGKPRRREAFGSFVVRAGALMLGRPYGNAVELPGQEVVDCDVSQFQCESFVESTLAVARCAWLGLPQVGCYRREVARMRYRHGNMDGYGSRLHYFEDWLADNDTRGVVHLWSAKLGGKKIKRSTAYMTDHLGFYPALQDGNELARVVAMEKRLSNMAVEVVLRDDVQAAQGRLQDGDVVAIVTRRPDILVHHAGFIDRDAGGGAGAHLLHASSAHKKVLRTDETIYDYLARRPERQGILVARPIAPVRKKRGRLSSPAPAARPSRAKAGHGR